VLVSLTDTIATSTSFAARRGDEIDPNQEMIGVGTANVAAGLFQGFAVSVSSSRTAVADQAGAKSQVTGLIGAGLVIALLVFFPSFLKDLPQTALAAVVIAAALSLADFGVLRVYWRVRKTSFTLSLVATAGVILFGVLEGILVAVALAIILFFRRSWWPPGEVLGYEGDLGEWHALARLPEGKEVPGVVVFRWEAQLFFANAGIFRQQVRSLALRRNPRWIVLQCEAITDIDVTAADMLKGLDIELNAQGIHVAFVELRSRLQDLILRYGLYETLDREHFYLSIPQALEAIGDAEPDRTVG
jgi:MFS superfamily sulfate permease-like transporter